MIPKSMKNYPWLAPACIFNITLAIFLLLVYFFPDFAPRFHENMFRRGLYVLVPFVSCLNILWPIFTLWYFVQLDQRIEAGEMAEED